MPSLSSRSRPQSIILVILSLFFVLASCSDDDTPTGGGPVDTDHTAPSVVALTPVDEYHVDVVFDEELERTSAEYWENWAMLEATNAHSAAAPGDRLYPQVVLLPDGKTVSLTTSFSMAGLPLQLSISGVKDMHGNAIAATQQNFTGSDQSDTTPPAIIRSTPSSGATNVPVGTGVVIHFSEPLDNGYYEVNFSWMSPQGPVDFWERNDYSGGSMITLVARALLDYDALQTITFTGLKDPSGNTMPETHISFTTATVADETKPTLIASIPADGAVHVNPMTTISLTFSEPINRYNFDYDITPQILMEDYPGTWSNGGRTITFTIREDVPLDENRQYMITVYPGGVFDLGGNTVPDYETVLFTTGPKLEAGKISGHVKGDPGTPSANPAGAVVFANDYYFNDAFNLTKVANNGSYSVQHLNWGSYLVRGYLDSNRDGVINIAQGDALGGFGADIDEDDYELEDVWVGKGDYRPGIDFEIYDPAAASGYVHYSGKVVTAFRPVFIGLFTSGTDAARLEDPLHDWDDWWAPWKRDDPEYPDWIFNQFYQLFEEGTYYVGAYLDADSSLTYDPAIDPAGVYGGFNSPTPLQLRDGTDYHKIVITMRDPIALAAAPAVSRETRRVKWPAPKKNPGFQQFVDALAKAQAAQAQKNNVDGRRAEAQRGGGLRSRDSPRDAPDAQSLSGPRPP